MFNLVRNETRQHIARLNANGTLDSFNPGTTGTNGPVTTLALQADGRIIAGGTFSIAAGEILRRIARFQPSGTVDTGFNPNPNAAVHCVALDAQGGVIAGGDFTQIEGQPIAHSARLLNQAAVWTFSNPFPGWLRWFRSGSNPEISDVTMQRWNGTNWGPPVKPTRISSGWEVTGLPVAGLTKWTGRTAGGTQSGSSGMVELIRSYGSLPVITVVPPADRPNVGGVIDLGTVAVGERLPFEFRLRNTGGAPMYNLEMWIAPSQLGAGEEDFIVNEPFLGLAESVPAPSGDEQFFVEVRPTGFGWGARHAKIVVTADGIEAYQFEVKASVTETLFQRWANAHGLTGAAALPDANPSGDGISNREKYMFGLDPRIVDRRSISPAMLQPDGPEPRGMYSVDIDPETGRLRIVYVERNNDLFLDIRPPEFSGDLKTFNTAWNVRRLRRTAGFSVWSALDPAPNPGPSRFVRLRFQQY